jgi:hypothetical protein
MDINLAIDRLGLNANSYKLTQSTPPHSIVEWNGPDPQPTEAQLQAAWDAYQATGGVEMEQLRERRNQLLAETDYLALSDVTLSTEMAEYRQALRDLPANTTDPANPVWPAKPEA